VLALAGIQQRLIVKAPPPLLGFNNNVRHKGRVFHIQTEDSGIRHPHIITHLFADGGRILKTTKTTYAEHVAEETMTATVRAMMQDQHKAMIIALRNGQFDHLFDEAAVAAAAAARAFGTSASGTLGAPPKPPAPATPPGAPFARDGAASGAKPVAAPEAEASPPTSKRGNSRPKLTYDPAAILSPTPQGTAAAAPTMVEAPASNRLPPAFAPNTDLDALERAAAEVQTPYFQQIQDLPPPPAAVLGNPSNRPIPIGGYRNVNPQPVTRAAPTTPSPRAPSAPPAGRYAPSRPAAIFATSRPADGTSIFGEELISEKSLDEVILSYLAEDLDSPIEKK
jgi:hypothetical protein